MRPRLSVQPTLLDRAGSCGGTAGIRDDLDLLAQLERDRMEATEGRTGRGIKADWRPSASAELEDEPREVKGAADVTWRAARGKVGVSGSNSESSKAVDNGLMGRERDPFLDVAGTV
jgi:hypothetical protein